MRGRGLEFRGGTGDGIRQEHVETATGNAVAPDELESLEDLERRQVARVLQASRGNKTKAAEILGVSRPRLNRLLAKYDLE